MSDERKRLDDLLEIMREHDLEALTVREGERVYELARPDRPAPAAPALAQAPAASAAPPAPQPGASAQKVTAPIIGVFYRSASPGAEPFVDVGDRVAVGQVLCILEAMKLMNEITSDHAGVVTRILAENGQLVSLGEEMFWIEP